MITLRQIVPALCLATALSGAAVYAATADAPTTNSAGRCLPVDGHWQGRGGMGGMMFVLHKLNLTPEQKTQVKSMFAEQKSQFQELRVSAQANRQALAATPPTDAGYAALIETAKSQCRHAHYAREPDLGQYLPERADPDAASKRSRESSPKQRRRARRRWRAGRRSIEKPSSPAVAGRLAIVGSRRCRLS